MAATIVNKIQLHQQVDSEQRYRDNKGLSKSIAQYATPFSSASSDPSSLYSSATPVRPVSPKSKHTIDVSYPISYPISNMRTPLPSLSSMQHSQWNLAQPMDGIHKTTLPTWDACDPDDEARESVEIEAAKTTSIVIFRGVSVVGGWRQVDVEITEDGSLSCSPRTATKQGIKRKTNASENGGFDEAKVVGWKKTKIEAASHACSVEGHRT
ncbi:hypothetical protein ACN47E_009549 [Coniothyrium glycines]